jgi:hypothetical protein
MILLTHQLGIPNLKWYLIVFVFFCQLINYYDVLV